MVPKIAFTYVDVRDLAELHVKALTQSGAEGKRFVAALAEPMSYVDMAKYLNELGYDGPSTRLAPNFLIRFASLFDGEAKGGLGFLDLALRADNKSTLETFDWKPRSIRQSVKDTAEVLTALKPI